jgi:hypothetical protein
MLTASLPVGASLRGDAQQEYDRAAVDRQPNEDGRDGEQADSRPGSSWGSP